MVLNWLRALPSRVRSWLRNPRVPTPIPKHLVSLWGRFRRASFGLALYRFGLLLFGAGVIIAALTSASVIITAIATIALFTIIVDDVGETARDIWDGNFWFWEP